MITQVMVTLNTCFPSHIVYLPHLSTDSSSNMRSESCCGSCKLSHDKGVCQNIARFYLFLIDQIFRFTAILCANGCNLLTATSMYNMYPRLMQPAYLVEHDPTGA